MGRTRKLSELTLPLVFSGLRWPKAELRFYRRFSRETYEIGPYEDRVTEDRDQFDIVVRTGEGRLWTPEPIDASWRNFGDLDFGSAADCVLFVQRRGAPLKTGATTPFQMNTAEWAMLKVALFRASKYWSQPDKKGISYPLPADGTGTFLDDDPYAASMLRSLTVTSHPGGVGLALQARTLAIFLVARAAIATQKPMPMRRCVQCGFWFEIRRLLREGTFCSASCRALNHQPKKETTEYGFVSKDPDRKGDGPMAVRVARAGGRRRDEAADKGPRHAKGGARARPARGARGRTTRRRRPTKT